MDNVSQVTDGSYPKLCGVVVNGTYVQGICNNSTDLARLTGAAGPHMPAVIHSKHFVEPPFKPRLVSG